MKTTDAEHHGFMNITKSLSSKLCQIVNEMRRFIQLLMIVVCEQFESSLSSPPVRAAYSTYARMWSCICVNRSHRMIKIKTDIEWSQQTDDDSHFGASISCCFSCLYSSRLCFPLRCTQLRTLIAVAHSWDEKRNAFFFSTFLTNHNFSIAFWEFETCGFSPSEVLWMSDNKTINKRRNCAKHIMIAENTNVTDKQKHSSICCCNRKRTAANVPWRDHLLTLQLT